MQEDNRFMIIMSIIAVAVLIFGFPKTLEARTINLTVDRVMTFDDQTNNNLRQIELSSPEDTILIDINSPGGEVNVLLAYHHLLSQSKAYIITRVSDFAASAAASLMCLGDRREISPVAILMFHQAYMYDEETGVSSRAPDATRDYITSIIVSECGHLIVPTKVLKAINTLGSDVFITGAEIIERQTKYVLNATKGFLNPINQFIGRFV